MKEKQELTYEIVMQMFANTDARLEKMFAETREQIKEISDDVWKSIKAMNKHIGGITKSLGEMAEETIYNVLEKDMTFCNVKFYDIDRRRKRKNKSLNLKRK